MKNDTMTYWITDTSLVYKDTLKLKLGYSIQDSLERLVSKFDTISLVYKKPLGKGKSKGAAIRISKFDVTCSLVNQPILDLNREIGLSPNHPVAAIDTSKIKLVQLLDGKKKSLKYKVIQDSIFQRQYSLRFKVEPETDYQLITDSLAFKDIYGQSSDSSGYKFKSQKDDYYGKVKLKAENVKGQMIIQLYTSQGIVAQKIIGKDQEVVFDYLAPNKYKLKAIYDANRNKAWDTGNFAKKIQPEKVVFYSKEIPVRSNWEMEETWKFE
jgi:hypothetical protein